MGWFTSLKIDTLNDLFLHELQDLYDAELRITDALPRMAQVASSQDLRSAFQHHLLETKEHVSRLERIFRQMGESPERETCEAIKGLLTEGEEIIDSKGDQSVRDAALIASAQRVEHYEIAGYGTARAFAQRLGLQGVAELLAQTLHEEGEADKILTSIAETTVNPASMRATG